MLKVCKIDLKEEVWGCSMGVVTLRHLGGPRPFPWITNAYSGYPCLSVCLSLITPSLGKHLLRATVFSAPS